MADEFHSDTGLPVHLFFKWKNHQHLVHNFRDAFDPAFTPRPHLWADVINNRHVRVFETFRKTQIEIGKIDENRGCRWFRLDSLGQPAEDAVEISERTDDLERSDDRGLADVAFELNARSAH